MSEARGLPARTCGHPVWAALSSYRIGPTDAALSFAERLARENGWSAARTARVMEEYRRFCFLAAIADHPVTPSDAVDQAWHLHLTYTRDYWERFCPDILGRALHHGPTAGGQGERHRFFAQYADTLASYEQAFGASPPADIWPAAAQRLGRDTQARRVHPDAFLIIPRRRAWTALLVLAAVALVFTIGLP
jgi:hypothetical protein